jgi:hypothetical protein
MHRETWAPPTINVGTPYYIAPRDTRGMVVRTAKDIFEVFQDISIRKVGQNYFNHTVIQLILIVEK